MALQRRRRSISHFRGKAVSGKAWSHRSRDQAGKTDLREVDVSLSTNSQNGAAKATTIHLTLQGKGGVGKSLVASILAQYLRSGGRRVHCVDTDPVNRTLAQYSALTAERINLRDEHNR